MPRATTAKSSSLDARGINSFGRFRIARRRERHTERRSTAARRFGSSDQDLTLRRRLPSTTAKSSSSDARVGIGSTPIWIVADNASWSLDAHSARAGIYNGLFGDKDEVGGAIQTNGKSSLRTAKTAVERSRWRGYDAAVNTERPWHRRSFYGYGGNSARATRLAIQRTAKSSS